MKSLKIAACAALASVPVMLASSTPARADDLPIDVNAECASQYPDTPGAFAAHSILVAPGTAYSWRCSRQFKIPGGGVIATLPLDMNHYCATRHLGHAVVLDHTDPTSWRCRS